MKRCISRWLGMMMILLLCRTSALAAPAGYIPAGVTSNCFSFGDHGYLVEYRYNYEQMYRDTMAAYVENYNRLLSGEDISVYFYFVNNCRSMDFTENLAGENPVYQDLMGKLTCVDHHRALQIHSMDDYEKWFYATDHHWNHSGAQQGYEDIIHLLLGEEEKPYQPVEEICTDAVFNGSYTQQTEIKRNRNFCFYRYELPECSVKVNGRECKVGRMDAYLSGKYSKNLLAPHYATFYGGDLGEIIYDTGNTEKENLLILCNSYGSSVRHLISRHFHKTHVVDMRQYNGQTGHRLNIQQYLQENAIDKVLILGDVSYFLYGSLLY